MEPFGGRARAGGAAHRGAGVSPPTEFLRALEETSGRIRHPAAKLRFLRESLRRYQTLDRCVRAVPLAPVRRALYGWLGLEGLRHLTTAMPLGAAGTLDRRTRVMLSLVRAGTVAAAMLVLGVLGGLGTGVYRLWQSGSSPVVAATPAGAALPAPPAAAPDAPISPSAAASAGVAPSGIWLVEKGRDFEQYSNGLRIDTSHALSGEARRYRLFSRDGQLEDTLRREPAGLLFHTSESDVWPLESGYNENLRTSSHRLLRYVARHRLYNYLVDRFGRVYRVVDEESKANHAGHSVWMQADRVYLNLNNAFLGVCFETRWEGGGALPITQAQFAAGRVLADHLRQRWQIPPEMCVAHGLTSVNPKKRLIGHHLDWARGFPFEAFGLPDQYQQPPPSVSLFGFGYDEDLVKVMGAPWPGVRTAEVAFAEQAARAGRDLEDYRRERQELYDKWYAMQTRSDEAPAGQSPTSHRSGG